jgi:prophage antirepressor-like protein
MDGKIKIFQNKKVRTEWDKEKQDWFFSVVDVCNALAESEGKDIGAYWRKLKQRLKKEGSEVVKNCHDLKMQSAYGTYYKTDAMDTKGILRLVQSIPSPKAEPFKMWLAQLGSDRLDEMADPEKAIDRGLALYQRKGYSEKWIEQRIQSKKIHAALEHEWHEHGIEKPVEFAVLTDTILKTWSGKTTREYKDYKNLKKENLRDNMTQIEILFSMLAEQSAKDFTEQNNPRDFKGNKEQARKGGEVALSARRQYELNSGSSAISPLNFKQTKQIQDKK